MFDLYIKDIHIDKVRNLENIDIKVSDKEKKHILITGKNGSGKTSLLDAMAGHIEYLALHDGYKELENAVIYDLENKTYVENGLSNVPYSGIVESYFKADELSKNLRDKFVS